jgi:hypothetical protein
MRILPYRILRPALITWLLFTVQTFAQTGQQDDLPSQGASPTTGNPQEPKDVGVDVSLGRLEVKQKIAAKLGISETEVPLAVHVPIELAERVCEKAAFEARANANRSCTATKYIPEIAEAARNHPQTSAVPEQ